ncbi:hypothetical protein BWQ96_08168 [Gracilariopsis chorda]|uniref:Uncharacterized protein n=1 Tax=Gracilariopsis chorda TaxID=448386 RepID=A0A2V3IJ61_9FLOR|nr:hypothetical protein BWQ96_08168 [Gracilariopsis chorda]|eukprot:PXF42136.1 hypothetical protein BWQ96_08168 [Gracilariopsis chorda]
MYGGVHVFAFTIVNAVKTGPQLLHLRLQGGSIATSMSSLFLRRAFTSRVPTGTLALQVIRIYFNVAIVLYHAAFYLAFSLSSSAPADALINEFSSVSAVLFQFVNFGFRYGVDAFFFLSGFCMAPKLKACFNVDGSKISLGAVVRYILLRWLRLAPMYTITSMIYAAIGNSLCPNLAEILLFGNLFTIAHDRCLIEGWSTVVDFQVHIVICVLALVSRSLSILQFALGISILGSALSRIMIWYEAGFPAWPLMFNVQDVTKTYSAKVALATTHRLNMGAFDVQSYDAMSRRRIFQAYYPLYFQTGYRLIPCMIGFLVWYEMYRKGFVHLLVLRRKAAAVVTGLLLMLMDYFALFYFHPSSKTFNKYFGALHEGFGSALVVGGLGLIVMACCRVDTDEAGDLNHDKRQRVSCSRLQHLLNNPIISFWSRSLYAIYQLHPNFVRTVTWVGPNVADENFSHAVVLVKGLMLYACTVAFSVPVIAVEQVCLELRFYLKNKAEPTSAEPSKKDS